MIALAMTVPIACWRKGAAREFFETERLPPPSTCYGCLLSLVGEVDRERHVGARVTGGVREIPTISTVLRTMWRVKDKKLGLGVGKNASPDFQQLVVDATVLILCDSGAEERSPTLEQRLAQALERPQTVDRFGGLSLGESTHLINDIHRLEDDWPDEFLAFVLDGEGDVTLPVWVDHVGAANTRYAVGTVKRLQAVPVASFVPAISPN